MQLRHGIDHVANNTHNPAATVRFYTEVMGAELTHAITAKGWGPSGYPDFVHFFFNIGGVTNLAFFFYFQTTAEDVPRLSHHVALHASDLDELTAYQHRLESADVRVSRTEHETIESIYWKDPNSLQLEMTAPKRALSERDRRDAELSVAALLQTLEADPDAVIEDLWARKGRLVEPEPPSDGPGLYVLAVEEFAPIIEAARSAHGVSVRELDDYLAIDATDELRISRKDTGLIEAVWFGALTGGHRGGIQCFDSKELLIGPTGR